MRSCDLRSAAAAEAMIAETTDDFHQSPQTGDLRAFVCVLIAVHSVTNYNKLTRANSGFSLIFKHSISQRVGRESARVAQTAAYWIRTETIVVTFIYAILFGHQLRQREGCSTFM